MGVEAPYSSWGRGDAQARGAEEYKVILRYLVSRRLASTALRSYLQKRKERRKETIKMAGGHAHSV